ncbi:hypothetical protein LINGRAHAP2_LOCUS27265 [Linum grandiflorum]
MMSMRDAILCLLIVFLIWDDGLVLQSCHASHHQPDHDPSLNSTEADETTELGAGEMDTTIRRGGKGGSGKGANGGSDMIRQPKDQRSGGCTQQQLFLFNSLSSILVAAVAIMQILFIV